MTIGGDTTSGQQSLDERARRVGDTLALAVTHEPEGAAAELFGLDEEALERVVACALASAGIERPVEVSLLLTGDEGLRDLNRDYRGKDTTTDVLSFPLLSRPLVSAPADQLWQPAEDDTGQSAVSRDAFGAAAVGARHAAPAPLDADDQAEQADDPDQAADDEDASAFVFIGPSGEQVSLGDIAISRDAVRRQAAEAYHSPAYELAYLLAHGVLHLIGYDDHTQAGYQAMISHQEAALACAGIAK